MRSRTAAAALLALSCSLVMSCAPAGAAGAPGNCAQLQDASLAISSCTEFLDAQPPASAADRAIAFFYRGTAFSMTNRLDEAIADLGRAIEADPAWPLPYNNRARALVSKGEPEKAIADYDKVVAINPANAAAYVNRALAYMKMKDFDHALADLTKSNELKPNNSFVIYNIGVVYENKGDRAQAEAEYRKALALSPTNRTIMEGLKRIGAAP